MTKTLTTMGEGWLLSWLMSLLSQQVPSLLLSPPVATTLLSCRPRCCYSAAKTKVLDDDNINNNGQGMVVVVVVIVVAASATTIAFAVPVTFAVAVAVAVPVAVVVVVIIAVDRQLPPI
jgi:hypothetical protein